VLTFGDKRNTFGLSGDHPAQQSQNERDYRYVFDRI